MNIYSGEFSFLTEKNHVISIVGGGGKTTILYALARQYAKQGARVLVTTTTHIQKPEDRVFAMTCDQVETLWEQGSYAVVGTPTENGKLKSLEKKEMDIYLQMADVVLIEADGSKGMPCKVPANHEPVLLGESDIVLGVMGMDAWCKTLQNVCFRKEEAVQKFDLEMDDTLDEQWMADVLSSAEGTKKNVGKREYYVVLNKCDSKELLKAAKKIKELLQIKGIKNCVLVNFPVKERSVRTKNLSDIDF